MRTARRWCSLTSRWKSGFQESRNWSPPRLIGWTSCPNAQPLIFNYDAKAALAAPDNAAVLAWPNTDAVFARFMVKILEDESAKAGQLTPECFKLLVNEVKAETGAKGKELFHPIRIIITGSHSGPEFDKLIPILEAGSQLRLPKHVLSVHERVEEFGKARASKS